jgi:hypothetical protein
MPRTPKRLWGPALVATGPATVYTAPAGQKTRLRFLWINNPSASIVTLSLSIGADAAATRMFETYNIPAKGPGITDSNRPLFVDITLEAGEIIQLSAGTNNVLTCMGSGEEGV